MQVSSKFMNLLKNIHYSRLLTPALLLGLFCVLPACRQPDESTAAKADGLALKKQRQKSSSPKNTNARKKNALGSLSSTGLTSKPMEKLDAAAKNSTSSPKHTSALYCGELPAELQRLVSLAPSVTESLFALGLGERIVGVTRYCDYPEKAKTINKIGGFIDPNVEAVAALRPDLVVAVPNGQNRPALDHICELKIPVFVTYNYGIEEVEESLLALGQIFSVQEQANNLVTQMRADFAALQKKLANKPRVKLVMLFGHKPLIAAGRGSYAQSLIEIAGGLNLAARGQNRYPSLSYETLLALAPEQIIDAYSGGMAEGHKNSGLDLQALKSIPAVKNHQIHRLKNAAALHPGPRAAKDAELIAKLIHPECF